MDSPEYKTLTHCYPTLVSNLKQSPSDVVTQLRPYCVLAENDLDFLNNQHNNDGEKAKKIVDVVINQVQGDPQVFHSFKKALKAASNWTETAIRHIEQKYSELTTAECSPMQESTEEETLPSHSQTTPNLYQHIEENPTYDTEFNLEGRTLEWETREMQGKFAGLIVKVSQSIRKNNEKPVIDVVTFLREIRYVEAALITATNSRLFFTREYLHEIRTTCNDISDIFTKLEGYYSWFNFELIEEIIAVFCEKDGEVNAKLSKYKDCFKEYCENRLCQFPDPSNGFSKSRDDSVCVFKIDRNWEAIRISEVNTIKTIICKVLDIKNITLTLRTINNGCIELTFNIQEHITKAIFPPSIAQIKALKEHGVNFHGK